MKYAPFAGLIVLLIALLSCRNSSPKKVRHSDPFYNDTGEGKFLVVPLIKPYRVAVDEGSDVGWFVKLHEATLIYFDIIRVEKIAVEKGVIMVFAPNNPPMMQSDPVWHWVVIIPDQKIEVGFDNEEDFLNYIRGYGIEEPNWVDPLEAFKQFERTGCLEWIPDCE